MNDLLRHAVTFTAGRTECPDEVPDSPPEAQILRGEAPGEELVACSATATPR